MRRLAVLGAAAAVAASLLATPSASGLGTAVPGTFLCQSSISVGGVSGTSVSSSQTLQSTVVAPATSDVSAPAAARVMVMSTAGGTLPLSPPVSLGSVQMTQLDVRLDVWTTTTNSVSAITGNPASAIGSTTISQSLGTVAPSTPWPVVVDVNAQLPAGSAGQRLWLRLKEFGYHWTAESGTVLGATTCRLVGAIVGGSGTVETPLYGFVSGLSSTWPESATNFTAGSPALFTSFGDRVTVTDVNGGGGPPPSSSCTVTDPSGCTTGQQISATVIAGTLSQQANAAATNPSSTAIVLTRQSAATKYTFTGAPAVTVATTAQVMEGALNPVTVTDVRGGNAGWSLTAQLSGAFTEIGGGQMSASSAVFVGVGCTPVAGSASRTLGAGGTLSGAVTLCGVDPGVDDSDGQSGGGQYVVTGAVELTVPAFQKAGDYSSTLVVTLT